MRPGYALTIVALSALLAPALAGCVQGLSSSNFSLTPTQVGWRVGDQAVFSLTFNPQGARPGTYNIDPVYAITEVKFEQDGIHFWGDYDTTDAAHDLRTAILENGTPVANYTLEATSPVVEVRVQVPSITEGQYYLDVNLFKIGWVKSGLFRVVTGP